jgi:poly(A) polymerase
VNQESNLAWNPQLNPRGSKELMPIITPAYPSINSHRKATRSTKERIQIEFERGKDLTNKVFLEGHKWDDVIYYPQFFLKYRKYLQLIISSSSEDLPTWQRSIETKLKMLIINFENTNCVQSAYHFPKIFDIETNQKPTQCFFWSYF